jgi:hypothetical protein
MCAVAGNTMVPERGDATYQVVYTTWYDLIAAVDAKIEPGEEDAVAPIVAHLLRAGHAQFLAPSARAQIGQPVDSRHQYRAPKDIPARHEQ